MISRPVFYTKPFLFKSMLLVFIFIVVPACGGGGGSDSSKDDFKSGNKDSTSSKTANSLSRDVYLQMPSTDGITLRWQTKSAAKSEVVYSANLEDLDEMKSTSKVATAISTKASSIQRALTDEQRTKHEVSLSGLEAEKRYYYVVRDGSKNLTSPSEDRYFMTLPVSLNTQSTRAWVLGNTGIDVQSTLAVLNGYTTYSGDLPTDFVLLLGNNVPQIKPDDYDTSLFGPLKSVFYNTAIWPTLGVFEQKGMAPNTSIDDPDAPYFSAFKLPKRGEMGGAMSNTEAYYSFDHGETHFVALNTQGLTSSNALNESVIETTNCVSTERKFLNSVWPILSNNCIACHRTGSIGPKLILTSNDSKQSYSAFLSYANNDELREKVWMRASGAQNHGGGNPLAGKPDALATLRAYMEELSAQKTCVQKGKVNQPEMQLVFNTQMLDWLKSDLSTSVKKWTVIYMHHGPYSKGSVDSDINAIAAAIRSQLIPVFDKYDVDLVLSGQSQSYERSYLIKGHTGNSTSLAKGMIIQTPADTYPKPLQAVNDQGVTYIVAGAASKTIATALDHPAMSVAISNSGSVVLDIIDNRMEVQFIDTKGKRVEQVDITKGQDLRQPRLMHGRVKSANRIALVFNERLNKDIGDVTAFKVTGSDGNINIRRVSLSSNQRIITLDVADLPVRKKLTVEVDGVADLAGNMAIGESTRLFSRFESGYKPKPPVKPERPKPTPPKPKPPIKPIPPVPMPELPVKPEPPKRPVPTNKKPIAVDDMISIASGKVAFINPLDNDSDPDGDVINITQFDAITANGGTVTRIMSGTTNTVSSEDPVNVALKATAMQSSTAYSGVASLAIDGNTSGIFKDKSVTHTAGEVNSWWQIQLERKIDNLERVVLFNRAGKAKTRLSNFRVSVYDGNKEIFGQNYFAKGAVDKEFTIDFPAGVSGDRVRVALKGNNNDGNGYLSLAEVEVWAGKAGEASGQLEYTPVAGFIGNDAFNYTIGDGNGGNDSATVNLVVNAPANNAPNAQDDKFSVEVGKFVIVNVLDNDTDSDGNILIIESFTQGTKGTVQMAVNNTLSYMANTDASGTDSFTYTINDGNGETATATVNVTITPLPNTTPVAVNDAASVESGKSTSVNVLANDSDDNGDKLKVTAVSQGRKGTTTRNRDNSITYGANANTNGSDSFTYTINDGKGETATATVNITITPQPNTAPKAVNDATSVQANASVTVNVLANDSDVDRDSLSVTSVTQGSKGSVTRNSNNSVTYKANANNNGTDSFTYTVSDGMDMSTATVNVTITPQPNAKPIATNDVANVQVGLSVTVNVLGNDKDNDGDTLSITNVNQGAKGSTQIRNGNVIYTANAKSSGTDRFNYTISDGKETATAMVNIIIKPRPNSTPNASNDSAYVKAGKSVSIDVLGNDKDDDGDNLKITQLTQGTKGSASVNSNAVIYTANSASSGSDTFTYTISDGKASDSAMVTVVIEKTIPTAQCAAKDFYKNTVKADITACFGCHVSGGIAGGTKLILRVNDNDFSYKVLGRYGNSDSNINKLLLKTIGKPFHGGGNQFGNANNERYKNIETLFTKIKACAKTSKPVPPVKQPPVAIASVFENVALADSKATLRKSAILMAGRLPTAAEYNSVDNEVDLMRTMRNLMSGERFGEFIKDTANRTFLTAGMPDPTALHEDFPELARLNALMDKTQYNNMVADMQQEPLELLRYIVENNRSYKEVLTADYTMVTRNLQKTYDAQLVSNFVGGNNWAPAKIKSVSKRSVMLKSKAYPHAGVLTTVAWLSRFPTTESNRNRHRTAKFLDQFLGVDLESFGQRPIDDSGSSNFLVPVMEDPNCLACHSMMDPIAGGFANWGTNNQYWQSGSDSLDEIYRSTEYYDTAENKEWYQAGDQWFRDGLMPGFEGKTMPGGYSLFERNGSIIAPISRNDWTVSSVAKPYGQSYVIGNVLDGKTDTFFTTRGNQSPPHDIIVDMGAVHNISSIEFVPRIGTGQRHIRNYRIRVSMDGNNWMVVNTGRFPNSAANHNRKTIEFNATNARYFELRNSRSFNGENFTEIAELTASAEVKPNNNVGHQNANGGKDKLQWLAREAVQHARFAKGSVRFWYKGIMGRRPMTKPQDTAANNYADQLAAFNAQEVVLDKVAKDFVDAGFKVKDLLISLMNSELFRANGSTKTLTAAQKYALSDVGVGHLLSAREINAKAMATTGKTLFDTIHSGIGLTYGGFDGGEFLNDGITEITPTSLNAFEVGMHQLVCDKHLVTTDFMLAAQQRKFMRFATLADKPDGVGDNNIKRNIQFMFERFLGEDLPINHDEVNTAFDLFKEIYQNTQVDSNVKIECEKGVQKRDVPQLRAWNGVLAFMMTDFRFLSE